VSEKGRKAKRKKEKWRSETEINMNDKWPRRVQVMISPISDLTKKAGRTANASRTCSNREGRENKYSGG